MSEADDLLRVARQWVQKAENDLKNATYTLQMGEDCPTDADHVFPVVQTNACKKSRYV